MHARLLHRCSLLCMRCSSRTHRVTHALTCSHACAPARTHRSTNGRFPLWLRRHASIHDWLNSVAPPRIDSRMHADAQTQFICHVVSRVESRTHALIHALMQCVNGQKPRLDTDRHHGSIQCEKRRFRVPPLFLSPAI